MIKNNDQISVYKNKRKRHLCKDKCYVRISTTIYSLPEPIQATGTDEIMMSQSPQNNQGKLLYPPDSKQEQPKNRLSKHAKRSL